MQCRVGCGACCIAPSISSAFEGMPHGKPAGVRCAALTIENTCALFGSPRRPDVCLRFRPEPAICGETAAQALRLIGALELSTRHTSTI
ncbi:MAG: YkgJ family cysteine cluster protein [Gammaproteobacteria bacterium]|nr:YkgJ family cysteine cluster protein [Gammaproteobacteria bacterium]